MASIDFYDDVQRVYLAYYGRPADNGGLAYWATQLDSVNGNLNAIIDSFANSDEANSLYGSSTLEQRITKVYQQLLGRDPEDSGKSWWLGELEAGRKTLANLALDVLYGAQNDDAATVSHRLSAAQTFTDMLGSHNINYSGDDAANLVRTYLSSITNETLSLDNALNTLNDILSECDSLSDLWDSSHGGDGGSDSGSSGGNSFLTDDMAGLLSLVALNDNSGILSTENLRELVIAKTNSNDYYHAFDPDNYQDTADGVLTVEELGFSSLGALSATTETVEDLFYGTIIKAMRAIDAQEVQEIYNFVNANQTGIQIGDPATMDDYIALMISVFSDAANPALFTDDQLKDSIVAATSAFVEVVANSDSGISLFDGFFLS